MKELLEILAKLWALISGLPVWGRILAVLLIAAVTIEIAQDALLGSGLFWVAARLAPWPQILEPTRAIATKFEIFVPGAKSPVDANGIPCPVGSAITLTYSRSADGWVAVAGWNAKEGLYSIASQDVSAQPAEKGMSYPISFTITSSAGDEYFMVLGKSKPFNAQDYFSRLTEQLKSIEGAGKGGAPQLRLGELGSIEAGRLGSCVS